jgi:hypothetical protein
MANKLQSEQAKENKLEQDKREALDKTIGARVIKVLGRPTDLLNVQVRKVWDDHYRVNVIVGANAGSVRVAKSYFVESDSDGNLISATPKITKQY